MVELKAPLTLAKIQNQPFIYSMKCVSIINSLTCESLALKVTELKNNSHPGSTTPAPGVGNTTNESIVVFKVS